MGAKFFGCRNHNSEGLHEVQLNNEELEGTPSRISLKIPK